MLAHELLYLGIRRQEDMMRRLYPVFIRELTHLGRECLKWSFIGILFLFSLWFLTDGLPRVVAIINGGTR